MNADTTSGRQRPLTAGGSAAAVGAERRPASPSRAMSGLTSPTALWSVISESVAAWRDDRCASMGAALAYYTLFSMAPLLLIVVSLAGLVFGEEAARGQVFAQIDGLVGPSGARAIQDLLASVNWPAGGVVATLTGLGLMLIGATTVFAELQDTLDHIWRAPARPTSGWWSLLRARLLSFGLILGVGFLLIVSLLTSAALTALQAWWSPWLSTWSLLIDIVGALVGFGVMAMLFAMIYKLMPRARIAWTDVWLGAVVTSALFVAGRELIGLYIGRGAVSSGFGAAGALVAVLVWVYYSAQIFLLGAEFTWVVARRRGHRSDVSAPAGEAAAAGLARGRLT
jgi:membrane protein